MRFKDSEPRDCVVGSACSLLIILALSAACLAGCHVAPSRDRSDLGAVAIRRGSFMGLHGLLVISETPGRAPPGPIKAVSSCYFGDGAGKVSVKILSYGDRMPSWCDQSELARLFAAVREQVGRYAGADPRVRRFVVRLVPEGVRYRRARWTLGRNNLKLDLAVSTAFDDAEHWPKTSGSLEADARSALVRTLAHEMFHIAVGFSGRQFRRDFSIKFQNELAASLVEKCVELSVLGRTLTQDGRRIVVEGYTGDHDPAPDRVEPRTPWAASILAAIRADKLLNEAIGDQAVLRDSPEADKVFAACRVQVDRYLGHGR